MPDLQFSLGTARTIPEKVEALKERFYPEVQADLSDINETTFNDDSFLETLEIQERVEPEEITRILRTRRTNRAPGSDSISNDFLKAMGEPLAKAVAELTMLY